MAKEFRLATKQLFLTFPQCDYPLLEFHSAICDLFGDNIDKGVCCQESHEDGNKHLHAAICLKETFRTRNVKCFDSLVSPSKHPNISGKFKGGIKRAFKYVMKESCYLPLPNETLFDLNLFLQDKVRSTVSHEIVEAVKEGKTLDDLHDSHPEYLLTHLASVERFLSSRDLKLKRLAFARARREPVHVSAAEGYSCTWNNQIASWLNLNLRKDRAHRQRQMWISAPPAAGKTSLIMWLEKMFNLSIYYWPRDEKWWDGYSDQAYDLIILDEYRAQKMITELNPILSGDPTPLSRRNAPPLVKRDMLPVIILSNFHPACCYTKVSESQLAPLLDRLILVEVPPGGVIRIEVACDPVALQPLRDDFVPVTPELPPSLAMEWHESPEEDGLSDHERHEHNLELAFSILNHPSNYY